LKLPLVKAAIEVCSAMIFLSFFRSLLVRVSGVCRHFVTRNVGMVIDIWSFDAQRGVYFEITYSDLIVDVQTRRQMISNAKVWDLQTLSVKLNFREKITVGRLVRLCIQICYVSLS
jgi:hypothetical protein